MLQNEFEKRIGRSVENDEYVFANALYMSCPDSIDKDEFCELYKGAKINTYAYRLLNHLLETITAKGKRIENLCRDTVGMSQTIKDKNNDFADFCIDVYAWFDDVRAMNKAVELIGARDYIKAKILKGYEMTQEDKELLMSLL